MRRHMLTVTVLMLEKTYAHLVAAAQQQDRSHSRIIQAAWEAHRAVIATWTRQDEPAHDALVLSLMLKGAEDLSKISGALPEAVREVTFFRLTETFLDEVNADAERLDVRPDALLAYLCDSLGPVA